MVRECPARSKLRDRKRVARSSDMEGSGTEHTPTMDPSCWVCLHPVNLLIQLAQTTNRFMPTGRTAENQVKQLDTPGRRITIILDNFSLTTGHLFERSKHH